MFNSLHTYYSNDNIFNTNHEEYNLYLIYNNLLIKYYDINSILKYKNKLINSLYSKITNLKNINKKYNNDYNKLLDKYNKLEEDYIYLDDKYNAFFSIDKLNDKYYKMYEINGIFYKSTDDTNDDKSYVKI
jgi:DNA repair ATPase RecN